MNPKSIIKVMITIGDDISDMRDIGKIMCTLDYLDYLIMSSHQVRSEINVLDATGIYWDSE